MKDKPFVYNYIDAPIGDHYTSIENTQCWIVTSHNANYVQRRLRRDLITRKGLAKELRVCHICDRGKDFELGCCANHQHVFLGTQRNNMQDCSKKGRLFFQRCNPFKGRHHTQESKDLISKIKRKERAPHVYVRGPYKKH